MRKTITILLGILCSLVCSCSWAKVEMKTMQVCNISKTPVLLIECKGIGIFGDPRDNLLTTELNDQGKDVPCRYGYKSSRSITTWGDKVHIKYPVIVKWAYKSAPKEIKETQFEQIMNLPKEQEVIRKEGSLNLVFYDDSWYLLWVPEITHLLPDEYLEILKTEKK